MQNSRNEGFSYYFCLIIEGSGTGSRAGSVPRTNGSGSGNPKTSGSESPTLLQSAGETATYRYKAYRSRTLGRYGTGTRYGTFLPLKTAILQLLTFDAMQNSKFRSCLLPPTGTNFLVLRCNISSSFFSQTNNISIIFLADKQDAAG